MHKILDKLKEEFFAILPPTIFFFVALHLLTFIRILMARGSHYQPVSTMSIAIASLILGKAVLIADMLPPINRYPHKPLAYNIAWKTLIYLLMASVIHYLERLIDFSHQAGHRSGQREAARGNCVAALLGGGDDPVHPDRGVLHGARTDSRDRQGKNAALILWANATAGILSAHECLRSSSKSDRTAHDTKTTTVKSIIFAIALAALSSNLARADDPLASWNERAGPRTFLPLGIALRSH